MSWEFSYNLAPSLYMTLKLLPPFWEETLDLWSQVPDILIMGETTSREPYWIYLLRVGQQSRVHYLYPVLLILKDHVLMHINQLVTHY